MRGRSECTQYYKSQALTGHGGLPTFTFHRGHGFFSNLVRGIIPFVKTHVVPKLFTVGKSVLKDVVEGKSIKKSLKKRGAQAVSDTFQTYADQQGSGIKRKRVTKTRHSKKKRRRANINDAF
jgi:hypothetical protein